MKIKKLFREVRADSMQLDKENRTIKFPFSSELPVDRWFGQEILSHAKGSADLSRLNDGGALLWNHNTDEMIGCVEDASMGSDSRAYCTVRFANTDQANEIMGMVADGILKNVSFGYQIKEMELQNPGVQGEDPKYLATKWMPYEVSFVSVPADPTVGVGRADSGEELEVKIINKQIESKGVRKMEDQVNTQEKPKPQVDVSQLRADAISEERVRIAAINALGKQFNQEDLARQLIEGGKTVDEARAAVLEKLGKKQIPLKGNEAEVGLTEKDKRNYSFMKAIRAQMFPNEKRIQEEASFEREVSMAAQEKGGKAARGFMVPIDILRHDGRRDLTVGSATAGGNLVATDLLSGSFIELLRNRSVAQRAGATVMNGLVGNIAIPKATGAATAYWVAESGAPTESQQAVGQVSMSPKTVGAYNDFSRKLLLQSSIDVENFIRSDLAAVIALELDRVAFYGTGSSNQPSGLKPLLAGGNQESNFAGATPTFAEVIGLETKVTAANGDIGSMSYIVNASMRGSLKAAVKVSGFPSFIMESDGSMNGYNSLVSNQIASGDVLFGVWSQMIMGFWSGLDLLVDPYSQSTSGTIRVVALQDCDIAFRHAESFARGNDNP